MVMVNATYYSVIRIITTIHEQRDTRFNTNNMLPFFMDVGDIYEYAGEKKTEIVFAFELNYISWPYNCIPISISRLSR